MCVCLSVCLVHMCGTCTEQAHAETEAGPCTRVSHQDHQFPKDMKTYY